MIVLNSLIEGKRMSFGHARNILQDNGCSFCSNFEYHQGKFDTILWRERGETIYLRIPFKVLDGMLDHAGAFIQFGTPYVIKHVVNIGLDYDENSFVTATTGLAQFQEPLHKDDEIYDRSRWEKAGLQALESILQSMNEKMTS